MTLRALGVPRATGVEVDGRGAPRSVELGGRLREVAAIRDDWLVQDLWWTDRPVDRHYYEIVVEPGRLVVAYHDAVDGSWHVHGWERCGPPRGSARLQAQPARLPAAAGTAVPSTASHPPRPTGFARPLLTRR